MWDCQRVCVYIVAMYYLARAKKGNEGGWKCDAENEENKGENRRQGQGTIAACQVRHYQWDLSLPTETAVDTDIADGKLNQRQEKEVEIKRE